MKLLLDTNVFLAAIFNEHNAAEAKKLLGDTAHELFISIFSLHSIGLILLKRRHPTLWPRFLNDLILTGQVTVVILDNNDLADILKTAQSFNLELDDAYQYLAAERKGLTLVSFDSDFDKTPRGAANAASDQHAYSPPNFTGTTMNRTFASDITSLAAWSS